MTMKKVSLLNLGIFITIFGCMDLNETPQSTTTPATFYATAAQVEASFAASMDKLWCQWCSNYSYGMFWFVTDDQMVYGGSRGDLNIPPTHATYLWKQHYAALLNINTALKAILSGKVKDADADMTNQLIGEARFLRAFNYFMLGRMYGDVPLYLENDDPLKSPKARAPIAEVYAQIVSDFTDAADRLPVSWGDNLVDIHWDSLYPQQPRKDAYLMDSVNGVRYTDYAYNNNPSVKKYLPP